MSRPQILNIVDSSKSRDDIKNRDSSPVNAPHADTFRKNKLRNSISLNSQNSQHDLSEYREKVDSVRCYWSKLVDRGSNENSRHQNQCDEYESRDEDSPLPPPPSPLPQQEGVRIVDSVRKRDAMIWRRDGEASPVGIPQSPSFPAPPANWDQVDQVDSGPVSYCPSIEIVDLETGDEKIIPKHAAVIKTNSLEPHDAEFDHVRYKVMKSNMFRNSMFGSYKKEAQFDGLLQYLQDYSFQELLINNSVVIIEPVRTKIEATGGQNKKTSSTTSGHISNADGKDSSAKLGAGKISSNSDKRGQGLRRHFFYHPIRVNRELIDEELPDPDTVRNVRRLFEGALKMRAPGDSGGPSGLVKKCTSETPVVSSTASVASKWDSASLSSGVSSGDLSSSCDREDAYSSSSEGGLETGPCCNGTTHYVSRDVLQKIRECGTSVTYYGGKVVSDRTQHQNGAGSPMTRAIMDEIRSQDSSCDGCCNRSDRNSTQADCSKDQNNGSQNSGDYLGVKFRLVKSNSCSSRLELVGTGNNHKSHYHKSDKNQHENADSEERFSGEESVRSRISRLEGGLEKESSNMMVNNKIAPLLSPSTNSEAARLAKWTSNVGNLNQDDTQDPTVLFYNSSGVGTSVQNGRQHFDDMEFEEFEVLECYDSLNDTDRKS